jgi:subtilisin family serine protease
MAIKNVIAFFMHEQEQYYALKALSNAESTDSFVIGDLDESEIGPLQEKGLIVQEQPAAQIETPVDNYRDYAAASSLGDSGDFFGRISAAASRAALFDDAFPALVDFYSVALRGPLLEARREQLDALGVTLGDRLPDGGYKARLQSGQVPQVNALPFVERVTWLTPAASAPQFAASSTHSPEWGFGAGESELLTFDIRLHDPADKDTVLAWLSRRNIDVVGGTARKIRFHAQADAPKLNELAMLSEVDRVDEYTQPELANDRARCLLVIDSAAGGAATAIAEDGTGQIVAVADTGIDDQHPDFQGRIVATVARGRPGDASDPHGHGTHVVGSVLGDGSASGGTIKGVAPQVKLFFQSLLDRQGKLGGLPVDLNDLFVGAE